jgi:hypothetical protein
MTQEELIADLHATIRFALQAYKYKSPRTHDATQRDAYFRHVADAIVDQIRFTWTFEPPDILRRKPPDKNPSIWHKAPPDRE